MRKGRPVSDHCDGERFFNPGLRINKRFSEFLRWRFSRQATPWPEQVIDAPAAAPTAPVQEGEIAVTFIGHATLLLRFRDFTVLTDPVFSERASPFAGAGPIRVRPPAIALGALPKIDVVVVSHNHY